MPAITDAQRKAYQASVNKQLRRLRDLDAGTLKQAMREAERYQRRVAGMVRAKTLPTWRLSQLDAIESELASVTAEFKDRLGRGLNTGVDAAYRLGAEGAVAPLQSAGVLGETFALDPSQIAATQTVTGELVTNLTDDAARSVAETVRFGVVTGAKPSETVAALMSKAVDLDDPNLVGMGKAFRTVKERAAAIAHTETMRAYNLSFESRLEEASARVPGVTKTWFAATGYIPGTDFRKNHRSSYTVGGMNGRTVAATERFTLVAARTGTTYRVNGPHDPILPASEAVHCVCTLLPGISELALDEPTPGAEDAYQRDLAVAQKKGLQPDTTQISKAVPPKPVQPKVPSALPGRHKTSKESQGWAAANLVKEPVAEKRFVDRVTGKLVKVEHTSNVSYTGLSPESANIINARVHRSIDAGLPRLKSIRARRVKGQPWAARMGTDGSLEINATQAKTPEMAVELIRKANASREELLALIPELEANVGTLTARQKAILDKGKELLKFKRGQVGDSLEDIINHEMGHHVYRHGYKPVGIDEATWRQRVSEAVQEAATDKYKYRLSAYAFENPVNIVEEIFGEAFTLYERGELADVPPKLLALFKKAMPKQAVKTGISVPP